MSLRFKIVVAGIVILLVAVGTLMTLFLRKPGENSVVISNLGSCAKNINPQVTANLNQQIYSYVKSANDYNQVASKASYKAVVREGSCRQVDTNTSANNTVISSSAILDIPDAKQSWNIKWAWVPKSQTLATDIGSATAECLPANELIYGDFHCISVLSLLQYGTPYYDPILKYVPYSGDSFNIKYSPKNKAVTVTILVPQVWASDPAVAKNIESAVPQWFTQNGLVISNYTVSYVVTTK